MYYYIEYQIFHKPKKEFIVVDSVTKFLSSISSGNLEEMKKKILLSNFTTFDMEDFHVQIISMIPLPEDSATARR